MLIRIVIGIKKLCIRFVNTVANRYYRTCFKSIGSHTDIALNHRIRGGQFIQIGNDCSLGTNLRLEAISKYANEEFHPHLIIENNVWINQNFHCTCAEKVIIRKGTSITANVGIFDIIHPYQNINENPRNSKIVTKPVEIGEDCLIGMNTVILPGTYLGMHCVVGANSVVSGSFPDYCVIVGAPARIVKQYDFDKKEWIKVK